MSEPMRIQRALARVLVDPNCGFRGFETGQRPSR